MRQSNSVRIIGGAWRRRLLHFPDVPGLRPTSDRVRETVFNWLGQTLHGRACLDLFAGSGALGFEALSRGAERVTFVESDRRAFAALRDNARLLGAANAVLVPGDALEFLSRDTAVYDIVFLDPPFARGVSDEMLRLVRARLAGGGVVYLENDRSFEQSADWRTRRESRAGRVKFHLLEQTGDAQGSLSGNI